MIKTLKSELKLRPTYDELVGMISSQGDPNRPSIDKVIDRKATIFRNNQFGSQFDNIDFLGLKKQEEDKIKQEQRNLQLRETAVSTGSSMGILTANSSSFGSLPEVYDMASVDNDEIEGISPSRMAEIRAEMNRVAQQRMGVVDDYINGARLDLGNVFQQQLPVGVDGLRGDDDEDEDEIEDLRNIPRNVRIKGKQEPSTAIQPSSSSSSSTARDIFVGGAKAGVETLAKAGATALAKSFLPV